MCRLSTARVDGQGGGAFEIGCTRFPDPSCHTECNRAIERPHRSWCLPWSPQQRSDRTRSSTVELHKPSGFSRTELVVTHQQLPDEDRRGSSGLFWDGAHRTFLARFPFCSKPSSVRVCRERRINHGRRKMGLLKGRMCCDPLSWRSRWVPAGAVAARLRA